MRTSSRAEGSGERVRRHPGGGDRRRRGRTRGGGDARGRGSTRRRHRAAGRGNRRGTTGAGDVDTWVGVSAVGTGGVEVRTGGHERADLDGADLVVVSPGVPPDAAPV